MSGRDDGVVSAVGFDAELSVVLSLSLNIRGEEQILHWVEEVELLSL